MVELYGNLCPRTGFFLLASKERKRDLTKAAPLNSDLLLVSYSAKEWMQVIVETMYSLESEDGF